MKQINEEKMVKFRKIAPTPKVTNNFQTKETKFEDPQGNPTGFQGIAEVPGRFLVDISP